MFAKKLKSTLTTADYGMMIRHLQKIKNEQSHLMQDSSTVD